MGKKVKTILISQPKPSTERSPYFDLASKHKLKIDFRSFIHVEGVDGQTFRQERIDLAEHGSIIFTSRNAVDHYFRMASELRYEVPDSTKYFCISESTAHYLQKYIVYRKRKIFHGQLRFTELIDSIKKHKKEKFLLPCADILKPSIPALLEENNIDFTKAVMYNRSAATCPTCPTSSTTCSCSSRHPASKACSRTSPTSFRGKRRLPCSAPPPARRRKAMTCGSTWAPRIRRRRR